MTARDFTPTDEQVEALDGVAGRLLAFGADRFSAVDFLASPAFQSIIAAAKAEARAEVAERIRALNDDPERVRPLRHDAETPTDFANDFEWAAMIAEGVPA